MTAAEAAEKYIKGFYCRPDGEERNWDEYKDEELKTLVPVFERMDMAGCKFLSVGHLYTTTMGLTAQIEVEFASVDILEQLETPRKPEHWFNTFLTELRGDQGNVVMLDRDWTSRDFLVLKVIVSESL